MKPERTDTETLWESSSGGVPMMVDCNSSFWVYLWRVHLDHVRSNSEDRRRGTVALPCKIEEQHRWTVGNVSASSVCFSNLVLVARYHLRA